MVVVELAAETTTADADLSCISDSVVLCVVGGRDMRDVLVEVVLVLVEVVLVLSCISDSVVLCVAGGRDMR